MKQRISFPITGYDILALGINAIMVGKKIQYLKEQWIASNFTLTKRNLINLLKEKNEI